MHERALVSKTALDLAALVGEARVDRVTLAINPETDPAVVEQAWRSVTTGTAVAEADVVCVTRFHVMQCLDCGSDYEGGKLSVCPVCGADGLIVDPANEVSLDSWVTGEMA